MTSREFPRMIARLLDMLSYETDPAKTQRVAWHLAYDVSPPKPTEPAAPDHIPLAQEIAIEFCEELARLKRTRNGEEYLLPDAVRLEPEYLDVILQRPVQQMSFQDFDRIARGNRPEMALVRWQEMRAAARKDLENGWNAARRVTGPPTSAWLRAMFFAIRERLRRDWPPNDSYESMLVDELAQLELHRQVSVQVLEPGSDPQKVDVATRTLERVQRAYHRALRMLMEVREYNCPTKGSRRPRLDMRLYERSSESSPAGAEAISDSPPVLDGSEILPVEKFAPPEERDENGELRKRPRKPLKMFSPEFLAKIQELENERLQTLKRESK